MITVNYAGYNIPDELYTRVFRPTGSGDYLLIRFDESTDVVLDADLVSAEPGTCILYRPGDEQAYSAVRDFAATYIHFSASDAEMDLYQLTFGELFVPGDPEFIDRMLRAAEHEYYTRAPFFEQQLDAYVHELLIHLSREFHALKYSADIERPLYRLFLEARYTMLSNCDKEWASTNMCTMVSMGRSQFYKYYNEFFGVSPMADLNDARIEKAKNLLTNRALTVTEVAQRCGYASIHHFSRTFKEHCGMSPLAYAKEATESE